MFGGLFGKKKQPMTGSYNVDGTQVSMDMIPTTAGGRYGDPMPQQQDQRGGFLKPYGTGQLIFSALSDLGAAINDRQGGALAGMTQDMMMQRERAAKQAEALRMQAEQMAAYQRLGYTPDQVMALGGELAKVQAQRMDAPKPGSFEWYMGATDAQRAEYDRYNPVIASTWQGPVPVSRASLGGGAPSAPVGKLTPIQPTIQNTPAPPLGANGLPTALSRAQYQATVNAMGKAQTDDWMRRNNIQVVN
jgi:hypothetical protein